MAREDLYGDFATFFNLKDTIHPECAKMEFYEFMIVDIIPRSCGKPYLENTGVRKGKLIIPVSDAVGPYLWESKIQIKYKHNTWV